MMRPVRDANLIYSALFFGFQLLEFWPNDFAFEFSAYWILVLDFIRVYPCSSVDPKPLQLH